MADAFNIEPNETISFSYYIRNKVQIHDNLKSIIDMQNSNIPDNILFELNALMEIIAIFENELLMRSHSNKILSSDIIHLSISGLS